MTMGDTTCPRLTPPLLPVPAPASHATVVRTHHISTQLMITRHGRFRVASQHDQSRRRSRKSNAISVLLLCEESKIECYTTVSLKMTFVASRRLKTPGNLNSAVASQSSRADTRTTTGVQRKRHQTSCACCSASQPLDILWSVAPSSSSSSFSSVPN